jgi:hypothetical protein
MNLILGGDAGAGLGGMGGGHGGMNPPGTIRVTQEELDVITRL